MLDTGLAYLRQAADPGMDDLSVSVLVTDAETLGNSAYGLLQELEGADADRIPHQVVGPFQRWVSGLGIKNTIFFRADHVANYELARFDYKTSLNSINDPSASLIAAVAAIEWPFMRLTVPSQALGMLPHFAIVGHELGHAIQERIDPDLKAIDQTASIDQLTKRLVSEGRSLTPSVMLDVQTVLASWIQEIKSDAVGFLVAGPAFFFALGGFFELSGGGYGVGTFHPPSEMRRRLMFDRLKSGANSHSDVFERLTGVAIEEEITSPHLDRIPSHDDLYDALKQKYGIEQAAICVSLIDLAETMAPVIFDEAERVLRQDAPDMIYGSDRLETDLGIHLDPLCHLVPPIENHNGGKPVASSLACILNVGWAALLTRLDRFPTPTGAGTLDVESLKMEKLHELLLKAVELAEARLVWEEQP